MLLGSSHGTSNSESSDRNNILPISSVDALSMNLLDAHQAQSTETDSVANNVSLIRSLAARGKSNVSLTLLKSMSDREVAKVLASLSKEDPALANQLMTSATARNANRRDATSP